MSVRPLRLYRFVVEVLDEPNCSDSDLESEFAEALEAYFEAINISVELVDASDCLHGVDDMAEA